MAELDFVCYKFGLFELQPIQRQLLVSGEPAALKPKAVDVLVALVKRAGQLVTKDELFELVWPGLIVEENNLQQHIAQLRRVLGAKAIVTVAGRGYRFTLEPKRVVQRGLQVSSTNLPRQLTSFIGRDCELGQAARLLQEARLLTLLGMGGIGKTRLALQVAAGARGAFPDGTYLLDLVPIRDSSFVPTAAAQILGVQEEPGRSLVDSLCECIRDRTLLLILDNCEHLIDACASLVTSMLRASGRLRIMATSREAFRVAGEQTYQVQPMGVPEHAAGMEAVSKCDAVKLFVDRARLQMPEFELNDVNARQVAAICQRLDGIPLAIELAAARVRVLPPQRMTVELSHRLQFLVGSARDLPTRQRTLRGAIDWSYDLLTRDEQKMFRQLAVFAGGCTVEAVGTVCNAENNLDVIDTLESLVGKSLVNQTEVLGAPRFVMLETIREYAGDRLNDSKEGKAVLARHLAFYLALAEEARLGLISGQQREWLQQLDLERENLLLAHRSCDEVPDGAAMGLRLVFAIRMYWGSRGLLELGKRVTLEALARAGARARNVERCRALFSAGQIECFMGQYTEGRTHLEESLGIADEVRDEDQRASITTTLALAALGEGDHIAAKSYFEKAINLSRKSGNKRELASSLNGLAQLNRMKGEFDVADRLYQQALALMREFGDCQNSAFIQLNLAIVAIGRKSEVSARESLQDVLAISVEMQSKPIGQCGLDVCAALAALCGEWKQAARFFGAVDAQMAETGYHRDPADEAFVAPVITEARKALGARTFDRTKSEGRALSYDDAINEARAWLTSLASRGGNARRRRH
jgi:non-specific serine/threonine protein kinase